MSNMENNIDTNSNGNKNINIDNSDKKNEMTRIFSDNIFRIDYYNGNSAVKFIASKRKSNFIFPILVGSLSSYFLMDLYLNGGLSINSFSTWIKLLLFVIVFFIYYKLTRIRYQSILIIFGIGIQLETGFIFGNYKTFIEKSNIISTLIYDNMTYMELMPTLCLIVKDEKSLIIPFSEFRIPMEKNITLYNTIKMV
ncbi:multi-pass transmembrane [Cryptosporidium bovis]|uniref:multi-pass transmembrane n=1 Tax=Cryptosporidium bovis TaxID=310047 RepID=UPI00351A25D1|nr:multi-pass transmembrane [Cryptosporidium bovis]